MSRSGVAPDDLEYRVSALEAGQTVTGARLNELEAWRRRDEPRTLQLLQDAQIADEVRKALRDASARGWSRLAKTAAALVAAATFAGSVAELLHVAGVG